MTWMSLYGLHLTFIMAKVKKYLHVSQLLSDILAEESWNTHRVWMRGVQTLDWAYNTVDVMTWMSLYDLHLLFIMTKVEKYLHMSQLLSDILAVES